MKRIVSCFLVIITLVAFGACYQTNNNGDSLELPKGFNDRTTDAGVCSMNYGETEAAIYYITGRNLYVHYANSGAEY